MTTDTNKLLNIHSSEKNQKMDHPIPFTLFHKIHFYCILLESNQIKRFLETVTPKIGNRRDPIIHHDNAKPHTSLVILQELLEVYAITPTIYNPNTVLPNYYLFRSFNNSLLWKNLISDDSIKTYMEKVFIEKDQKLNENGIIKWLKRCNTLQNKMFSILQI